MSNTTYSANSDTSYDENVNRSLPTGEVQMNVREMTVSQLSDFYARWEQRGRDDATDSVYMDWLVFKSDIAPADLPGADDDTLQAAFAQYMKGFKDTLGVVSTEPLVNDYGSVHGTLYKVRPDANDNAIIDQLVGRDRYGVDVWDQAVFETVE